MVAESFSCAFDKPIVDVIEHPPQGSRRTLTTRTGPRSATGFSPFLSPMHFLTGWIRSPGFKFNQPQASGHVLDAFQPRTG